MSLTTLITITKSHRKTENAMLARPSSEFLTTHTSVNPLAVKATLQFLTNVFPHILSFKTGLTHIKHIHFENVMIFILSSGPAKPWSWPWTSFLRTPPHLRIVNYSKHSFLFLQKYIFSSTTIKQGTLWGKLHSTTSTPVTYKCIHPSLVLCTFGWLSFSTTLRILRTY